MESRYRILVHGGAGTILPHEMTPEKEAAYKQGLSMALEQGHKILAAGGSALDAVEAAVKVLEDNPLFNAGKGAVFTHAKKNEMDAAIMCGTGRAGAVAGVSNVKNPISAARKVLEHSEHVLLTGKGAELFAQEQGLKLVDSSYFFTEFRYEQLLKVVDSEKAFLDHNVAVNEKPEDHKYGTVGAVALDKQGHVAAATSTGGLTNKKYGRVGDSPIIGAGTYANDSTCAVSATGYGELFIKNVVAYDIAARMRYGQQTIEEACRQTIAMLHRQVPESGGVIAIDAQGNFCLIFNTPGMYRGYMLEDGKPEVAIYK